MITADLGRGRQRNKLRLEQDDVHAVERDMEEIQKEQDALLKIFEDELLDGAPDMSGKKGNVSEN